MSVGEPLQGERLKIRDLVADDVESLLAMRREPEIVRWWGKGDDKWPADMGPKDQLFAIIVGDELAGHIEMYEEDEDPDWRFATIDIFVRPDLIGQGYGTEALQLMIKHLSEARGHHRITIDPATTNEAAIRSYTKVGFEPVGTMKKYWRDDAGVWQDSLLMELIIESNL
jgi:aminoglycoside 6'-N-acetyltransferase